MLCHICGHETEWTCRDCEEPVCEDCCVPYTQFNQIDYTLCTVCHEGNQAEAYLEREREWKEEERLQVIKDKRKATRRANWIKPENVAKRKAALAERRRLRVENNRKMLAEAFRIVNGMIR